MPTKAESTDPPAEVIATESTPSDRDERRIEALKRVFRRATQGEQSIGLVALRRLGAGLSGKLPEE